MAAVHLSLLCYTALELREASELAWSSEPSEKAEVFFNGPLDDIHCIVYNLERGPSATAFTATG